MDTASYPPAASNSQLVPSILFVAAKSGLILELGEMPWGRDQEHLPGYFPWCCILARNLEKNVPDGKEKGGQEPEEKGPF